MAFGNLPIILFSHIQENTENKIKGNQDDIADLTDRIEELTDRIEELENPTET